MTCENFLSAYAILKSQEDGTSYFSVAATERKLLALNFYGSLQFKENIYSSEFLINEGLRKYLTIVDCKDIGGVNNYADYVLSILSNFPTDERHNWKSHLTSRSVKNYLKLLHCSKSINCKNSELLLNNFKTLKSAFAQYEKVNTSDFTEVHPNDISQSKKNLFEAADSAESKNVKIFSTERQCDDKHDSGVLKSKDSLFFRTARDELQMQNSKKFGKISNLNEKYIAAPLKKSLGTRKSGVYGKFQPPVRSSEVKKNENKMEADDAVDERLKNIDPAMIELIKNEIMDSDCEITWDDIAGLQLAKNTIQEIVVWPMLRPDIFTGLRRPPKGILLFGPPGTGKTLIGKCIASQSNSTFFSISASSLTSKWVGDGEKMVRTLFAVARVYQPSVVFIDEIDSLLTQRSDSDHECSRRIKTEFLVQLDGAGTDDEDRILIIGATNRPQELDEAARRRLVKRLYIPLPDEEARKKIIQNLISSERHSLMDSEIQNIAKLTKGYSGADMKNLCQEASLGPIRSISPSMIKSISPGDVRPLNAKDFESALCRIKSSVAESDLDIYLAWDKQYGCGSALN